MNEFFAIIGTISFALSGALVAIKKKMDIFGVCVLAVITSTGGGLLRDIIIGKIPPSLFANPFCVYLATFTALITFAMLYKHKTLPQHGNKFYSHLIFWSDTLGLASFVITGVNNALIAGYNNNAFLLIFSGTISAVGGGMLRDTMALKMPDIFVKQVYALACIVGASIMVISLNINASLGTIIGFISVVLIRFLAKTYNWNLPHIEE